LNKGSTENGHTGESGCIGSSRASEIYHAIKWNSRCKLSFCWRHFVLLATLLGSQLPASRSRHIQHRTKRSTCVSSFLKQRSLRCPLTVVSWHEFLCPVKLLSRFAVRYICRRIMISTSLRYIRVYSIKISY